MMELIIWLQKLHEIGYLHYDLKEDNIILALEPLNINNHFFNFILIDYGLSVEFIDENNKHNSKYQKYKCGNYYYASIKELEGQEIGRKHDLISLLYIIFNWISPVPWCNVPYSDKYPEKLLEIKKLFNPEIYYQKYTNLINIYKDIESLCFDEKPNYEKYKNILESEIKKIEGYNAQNKYFDWEVKIYDIYKYPGMKNKPIYENKDLKNLFSGYPKEFIIEYCEKFKNLFNQKK